METSVTDSLGQGVKLWRPVSWLLNYLQRTRDPTGKPYDFAFLLGPSYNSTMKFGIGGGVSCGYTWDLNDITLKRSDATVYLNASITGMVKTKLEGHNYMKEDRNRWEYELGLEYLPMNFWGIGYDQGKQNDNKSEYRQFKVLFRPNWLFRLVPHLYVGPELYMQYVHTYDFEKPWFIGDQRCDISTYGAGVILQYDSRDIPFNAYRGNLVKLQQMFYPKFANHYDFQSTEVTFDTFHPVWKGCILAIDVHGQFLYGEVPWTMLSLVGLDGRMRGYYEGRYRDRDIVEAQAELRQHIYDRFGMVAWVGAANVFHDVYSYQWNNTLPSYGLGLRVELKKRVNIRLDFGFTKNKPGFDFKLYEAF